MYNVPTSLFSEENEMNIKAEKVTITYAYVEFLGEDYQVYADGSVDVWNDHCEAFVSCGGENPHYGTVRDAGLACLAD